jgi:hypothetical protein
MTRGGEGYGGQIWTNERKSKLSYSIKEIHKTGSYLIASKTRWLDSGYRNKVILAVTKALNAPGMHEKLSLAIKAGRISEVLAAIGRGAALNWQNPVYREITQRAMLEASKLESEKQRKSQASVEMWADDEKKVSIGAKISEARKGQPNKVEWTPERRAAQAAKMREVLKSPEMKAQRSAALRARWATGGLIQPSRKEM